MMQSYLNDPEVRRLVTDNSRSISPSPVSDSYRISSDGGMVYDPISKEKAGDLSKYNDCKKATGVLSVGNAELKYSIPENVTAYDAVPVDYELIPDRDAVFHVEANALEDEGKPHYCYDLALPGRVDIDFSCLGYVRADLKLENRPYISADLKNDRIASFYPNYKPSELMNANPILPSDYLWFRIGYKNVGNTVLDGDGGGTFCFEPLLFKKGENGDYSRFRKAENLFYRIDDELFPGEYGEKWITFDPKNIEKGDYKLKIRCLVRNETDHPENFDKNIWWGEVCSESEMAFSVSDSEGNDPLVFTKTFVKSGITRNRWLHTYEEFMTSFNSHLDAKKGTVIRSRLYLQPAPWTSQAVIKFIREDDDDADFAYIPLNVETESVKVRFNPENDGYAILKDGTRFPAIQAQSMVDMRGNCQESPYPEKLVYETLAEMKSVGINVVNTTAAFEFDSSLGKSVQDNIDAFWYSADLMRNMDLRMEGFITYPYEDPYGRASLISGEEIPRGGFGSAEISHANAVKAMWEFKRWGDNYWTTTEKDLIPLSVEDTRGWERIDFNARYPLSGSSLTEFRGFISDLYGDIGSLNEAWNTEYSSFDEINPESGSLDGPYGYRNFYYHGTFGEWDRALADYDSFRTLQRLGEYSAIFRELTGMPTARLNLRTEGANWIVTRDGNSPNSHYRHVFYSQRRCAIIPELVVNSGLLYAHSDYTTLPYTPSEVSALTRDAVKSGIHPILLPQFDRMRDIAVNEKYGKDFSFDYNLSGKETRGVYINTVCSAFEWFRATYEAGGTPGILWQDYLCDGYATSTQKKEIAFFTQKLKEAMDTPEGRKWATDFSHDPSVLSGSEGKYAYGKNFILSVIGNGRKKELQ